MENSQLFLAICITMICTVLAILLVIQIAKVGIANFIYKKLRPEIRGRITFCIIILIVLLLVVAGALHGLNITETTGWLIGLCMAVILCYVYLHVSFGNERNRSQYIEKDPPRRFGRMDGNIG